MKEEKLKMTILQPTVINESHPADMNCLYDVIGRIIKDPIGIEELERLVEMVQDLKRDFVASWESGSGLYDDLSVDMLVIDCLARIMRICRMRKINLDVALKQITREPDLNPPFDDIKGNK